MEQIASVLPYSSIRSGYDCLEWNSNNKKTISKVPTYR